MHQENEWDDCHFEMLNNFFLTKYIAPCNYDMLQIHRDVFQTFTKLFALWIPISPEKNDG